MSASATRESTGARILFEEVSREYPTGPGQSVRALDRVNLDVAAGTSLALAGPSGSGKSTLLNLIGGMDRPDRGRITVGATVLSDLTASAMTRYRRRVGFVFQRFHLLPALSVLDNVLAPVMPRRVDFDAPDRARELLDAVGLADRAHAMPHELSGGQQQRVAIARALLTRPPLVLADEPTGSLDASSGEDVIELMLELHRDHDTTLIIATHNPEVSGRCERHLSVRDGRVERVEES